MTASCLRRESARGRLVVERIAGIDQEFIAGIAFAKDHVVIKGSASAYLQLPNTNIRLALRWRISNG
jgi:hypothetical protein